jgi:hypothetical protein
VLGCGPLVGFCVVWSASVGPAASSSRGAAASWLSTGRGVTEAGERLENVEGRPACGGGGRRRDERRVDGAHACDWAGQSDPPAEPRKAASPKAKIPPTAALSQQPGAGRNHVNEHDVGRQDGPDDLRAYHGLPGGHG